MFPADVPRKHYAQMFPADPPRRCTPQTHPADMPRRYVTKICPLFSFTEMPRRCASQMHHADVAHRCAMQGVVRLGEGQDEGRGQWEGCGEERGAVRGGALCEAPRGGGAHVMRGEGRGERGIIF